MIFVPHNRNISIELLSPTAEEEEVGVLLPTDYQEAQVPYTVVRVGETCSALDCQSLYTPGQLIVVETHMIREINYGEETFYTVLENYVLGELRGGDN